MRVNKCRNMQLSVKIMKENLHFKNIICYHFKK